MVSVLVRFLALFIPTCAVATGGLWLGIHHTGLWGWIGWTIGIVLALAAVLQLTLLIQGLIGINRWAQGAAQKLQELEQRDALFAQGKTFEESLLNTGNLSRHCLYRSQSPRSRHAF